MTHRLQRRLERVEKLIKPKSDARRQARHKKAPEGTEWRKEQEESEARNGPSYPLDYVTWVWRHGGLPTTRSYVHWRLEDPSLTYDDCVARFKEIKAQHFKKWWAERHPGEEYRVVLSPM